MEAGRRCLAHPMMTGQRLPFLKTDFKRSSLYLLLRFSPFSFAAFRSFVMKSLSAPYALTEPSASPETTKRFWKTAKSTIMGIWARIEAAKIHSQRVA